MKITIPRLLVALGALLLLSGCDDGPPTAQPSGNQQPSRPQLVVPTTGTAEAGELVWLEWRSHDPEGDSINFSLYTGNGRYPEFAADMGNATRALVRTPANDTVFVWGVVATDPQGRSVPSEVWRIPIGEPFRYPIGTGNTWTYTGVHTYSNVRHGSWIPPDPISGYTEVTDSLAESELGPYGILHEVVDIAGSGQNGNRSGGTVYLMNRVDGLFYFGYDGQTITTPNKSATGPLKFSRFNCTDVNDLTSILLGRSTLVRRAPSIEGPIIYSNPPKVLRYPPEIGVQWSYMRPSDNDGGLVIDKKYTGITDVTVPAGTFTCYEIAWMHDLDRDGRWDDNVEIRDYICEQGLIKRTIIARGVTVSTYDRIYAAVADLTSVWELESVSVANE